MKHPHSYDTIVIGGGPAGTMAATLLAQNGRRVALLEKEKFPRYHVGESMIPYCYFPLEKIGIVEKLKKSAFTKKYSVQFASSKGKISQPFYFQQHLDHDAARTWQVVRSEFDLMMLNNAREKGVKVFEETPVKEILQENGAVLGVKARTPDNLRQEFRAPLTIDASGRNGFFVTRKGWRIRDPFLQKISIWTYYKGAKRDPGIDEGATTVAYLPRKGWFWYIPLPHDIVSVGVVADKDYLYRDTRNPQVIFQREVENNLWIKDHLSTGQPFSAYYVTGDYSYRSRYCAADGVMLTGDAFAFLDPVFSTGLLLALTGGQLAAEAAERALAAKDVTARQFRDYGETLCQSIETMRKLVYSFYDEEFNWGSFFKKHPAMVGDVTDCLIGRLDRDYQALFEAMADFVQIPPDLPYGRARVAGSDPSTASAS